jgi:hypothetical protein
MTLNSFRSELLSRRAYFGWSCALVLVFALLAPLAHTVATATGDPTFALIYVFCFGACLAFIAAKRVADFGGQAELWVMAIFTGTFCEAAPFEDRR